MGCWKGFTCRWASRIVKYEPSMVMPPSSVKSRVMAFSPSTMRRAGSGVDAEHVGVARQCAGAAAEDDAPAGKLIEHREAVGDMKRVMVGDADDTGAEHDALGARSRQRP